MGVISRAVGFAVTSGLMIIGLVDVVRTVSSWCKAYNSVPHDSNVVIS